MDIGRPVNSHSRSLEGSPFLTLPSELVKLVCSFLSLQQVKDLRLVSKSLSRMVIEFKEKEEKHLMGKLSTAILKTGLLLTDWERDQLEKLERSQEMKRACASWKDIGACEKAWTDRVIEILGASPGFLTERSGVRLGLLEFLHPYARTPIEATMTNVTALFGVSSFVWLGIRCNPEEEISFAPSCHLRMRALFEMLTAYLFISNEEKYIQAMKTALEGEYRGEEGNAVLHVLVQLQIMRRRPYTEMLLVAKKMDKEQKEKSYLLILDRVIEGSFISFYSVVEEMLEEDLSGATQNQILQKLAKADISRGIEKALKLRDRSSVKKQAFIDIVTHFLPHALLAGEEVCKQMILLMENIGKEEEGDAFEIVRMLQFIMDKESVHQNFWEDMRELNGVEPEIRQRDAVGSLLHWAVALEKDKVEVSKRALQLLRPFEHSHPTEVMDELGAIFSKAMIWSQKESQIIEILHIIFGLQNRHLVRAVIRSLFEDRVFSKVFKESDIFYRTLDKEIQEVEEREWIEQKIYQVARDETDYPEVNIRLLGEMIKRFGQNGRQKEEVILAILKRFKERENRDDEMLPLSRLPLWILELIKEVQAPRRRNQLMMSLEVKDLIVAVCEESLSFDEVLRFIEDRGSNKRKEGWLEALGIGGAILAVVKQETISLFLEKYQPHITEKIKERILSRLIVHAPIQLVTERLMTLQKVMQSIKEERSRELKEMVLGRIINVFYWMLDKKECSLGELISFMGEMEEGEVRDKGFNEIARLLTTKDRELFPMFEHAEWMQGIETFLRAANEKGIEAFIDYANNERGLIEIVPKLIVVAERVRKKEVFLLLIKKVENFVPYREVLYGLIFLLHTLAEEGDQESLMACTPYWIFLITSRVIEKGEALRMIQKIENKGEREKALLGLIKNYQMLIRESFFSRGEMLTLIQELTDQEARDYYVEEVRAFRETDELMNEFFI